MAENMINQRVHRRLIRRFMFWSDFALGGREDDQYLPEGGKAQCVSLKWFTIVFKLIEYDFGIIFLLPCY